MCTKIKILIVEHNPGDLELIEHELKHGGIDFVSDIAQNEQEYVKSIIEFIPDIILSDYCLPSFHGSKAFSIREEIVPGTPFIFVSGSIGEEKSIEYIKNGVTDYVLKDKLFTLAVRVKRALKEIREKQALNKTARELALSESLLIRAQQLAQLGSWELDFADNVLTLSVEGCRIFGIHPDQNRLSPDTWRSLVHPEDIEEVLQDISKSMDSLQDTTYRHRIILQDGNVRHICSESKFELDSNGKPTGMYGTMQDVTEKINAEELREFEKADKEALINNTDDLIWSVSNDFKLIAANKAFIKGREAMTGLILKPGDNPLMKDVFSGDDLIFWEASYKKVLSGESLKEEVYTAAGNSWKESWADIRFNPVYKDDRVVAVACYSRNITENKLAEKKINESEQRYRSLVEQATDAICITDASMKFTDINPYALGIFGYTREEALQLSLRDILFDEDLATNPIKLSELKLGKTTRNERRLKRKDGTAVDMAVSTQLTEDGRLIMFGHDITERKKSEEALRESEMRLRQVIDLVPHFIFAKDAEGTFVLANETVAKAYGCTVEALIGKTDADYNSKEEEVAYFRQEDFKIINSGIIKYNIEETITDSAGKIRILSTTKIPYISPGCDTPGVLGVSVDISEHKRAEAILKENEDQLTIATQIAKLGYWEFDVTKNLFKFNDQFYSIFKTTAEQVGGYTMSSERYAGLFVHPDDALMLANETAEAIKSPDPNYSRQIEHRIKYPDGEIGYMTFRYFIGKNEMGRTIKVFGAIQDITDRKKAEEAVINNELRFRTLTSNAPVGIFQTDARGKTIYVNETWLGYTGMAENEALGDGWMTAIHPDDRDGLIENWSDEFQKGIKSCSEYRLLDRKGNIRWVSGEAIPLFNTASEIVGYIGTLSDITERKNAEVILRKNERQLTIATQIAKLGYWEFDIINDLFTFNDQFYAIFKTTAEKVGGYTMSSARYTELFVHPDEREIVGRSVEEAINSGDSHFCFKAEHRIIYATGEIGYISVHFYIAKDSKGHTIKTFGANQDISERKKAESILKESEDQLVIATQIAKLGYWEFDVTKNLFKFNDQFYSIFKATAEAVGGYTMSSEKYAALFVHPDDIPLIAKEASDSIKSHDSRYSRQIEYRIKYADGGIGYVLARFFILKNEFGRTIKTFGAIQDITDRKKTEETLLRSEADLEIKNKQLQQKNKELEQFAFVASHDMQEPLRTISSFVELLQKQYKGKLDEKADRYLNFILQSSDRMKVLIKDLLDYSRIGRKKELDEVDCNIVLQEVCADLGCAIKETGSKIEAGRLPVIKGYPTEIKQLFQNLVANAIKFRRQNKTPYIIIGAKEKGGCWEFTFKDNGIGIEERHMERIFIIFQRLHNRKEYEGSGIGLAHCKKIVELHGGKIWIESKPGDGSTFYFTLPAGEQAINIVSHNKRIAG